MPCKGSAHSWVRIPPGGYRSSRDAEFAALWTQSSEPLPPGAFGEPCSTWPERWSAPWHCHTEGVATSTTLREGAGVTGLGFETQRSPTDAETFFAIGGRRLGTSQLAPPPVPARSQAWRSLASKRSQHPSGTVLLTIPLGSACEHGQIGQIAPSQVAFVHDPGDHGQQYGRNRKFPRIHWQQQGRDHRVPRIPAAQHPNGREHRHQHEIERHKPPDIPSADRPCAIAWWRVPGQLNLRSRDEDYGHANPVDHVFEATVGFNPKPNSRTDGHTAPSTTLPGFACTHCTPPSLSVTAL